MKGGIINVALIGNPNTGKTSLFNQLTGLNQKVGNYPGITVDKKQGKIRLSNGENALITDLPGTYSLNPSSYDERVAIDMLLDRKNKDFPDVVIVVTEVENLKRNLLIYTQVKDLNLPVVLAINMSDRMDAKGISIDIDGLEKKLATKIHLISTRKGIGIEGLKNSIASYDRLERKAIWDIKQLDENYFGKLEQKFPNESLYKLWLFITRDVAFSNIQRNAIEGLDSFIKNTSDLKRMQHKETIKRYLLISEALKNNYVVDRMKAKDFTGKLDRILTHKVFGYLIFFTILFLIFQAIYNWSGIPMDFIDESFGKLSEWVGSIMPEGTLKSLVTEGIIPGIGGVVIFIPQIVVLFFFLSLLEESGYMSRAVFIMDKIMRKFGLSGKSVVPLLSGTACAIPAIMATRNIENWKERLITILVTPFTTCSARLPVYAILIALIVPENKSLGIFNVQGLLLMFLYFIGFAMAIISSVILHYTLKSSSKSYFVIEMPTYKVPLLRNIVTTVLEKTKAFIIGAGQIILAISIILWFLASYGPGDNFKNAEDIVKAKVENQSLSEEELVDEIASFKVENSYIGIMGKGIEPLIKPLGYDWKIGIALITSFAAREVFVGSLATIYSVGSSMDSEDENTIKARMNAEINPDTGGKRFTFAVGMSLLIFYAFAMQCMSTIAIVKRETKSWKWPMIQMFGMTAFAYFSAWITYILFK